MTLDGFTKIRCGDGRVISVGGAQREHLEKVEAIAYAGRDLNGAAVYAAPGHTALEINAIVISERSLLQCDFCHGALADYKQPCKAFELLVGANAGGQLGGPYRPIFVCSECKPYLVRGDRRRFLDYLADRWYELARERHILKRGVTKRAARAAIEPMLNDVVSAVLHNKIGEPEGL